MKGMSTSENEYHGCMSTGYQTPKLHLFIPIKAAHPVYMPKKNVSNRTSETTLLPNKKNKYSTRTKPRITIPK